MNGFQRRNYRNPWNDPNSAGYGGGAPRLSYPGAGQQNSQPRGQIAGTYGGGAPQPFPSQPFPGMSQSQTGGVPQMPGIGQYGGGQLQGQPYTGVTGWQSGGMPQAGGMSPQVDPAVLEQLRRQRMLQQQMSGGPFGPMGGGPFGQMGGGQLQGYPQMGLPGQISAGLAENIPQNTFAQPQPAWAQRTPQNFGMGQGYNPFTRW